VLAHLELRAAVGKNCLPLQQEICQNWLTVQPHDMEKEQSHHIVPSQNHMWLPFPIIMRHIQQWNLMLPLLSGQLRFCPCIVGAKQIGNVCEGKKERQK